MIMAMALMFLVGYAAGYLLFVLRRRRRRILVRCTCPVCRKKINITGTGRDTPVDIQRAVETAFLKHVSQH